MNRLELAEKLRAIAYDVEQGKVKPECAILYTHATIERCPKCSAEISVDVLVSGLPAVGVMADAAPQDGRLIHGTGSAKEPTGVVQGIPGTTSHESGSYAEQFSRARKSPQLAHYTDRARKVLQLANQEAQRLNHEFRGTEHILLGLVKEGSGTGAEVLKSRGVDIRTVRLEVEKLIAPEPEMVTMGKLPFTPRANLVLRHAEQAAEKCHGVGTEHILTGLLREKEGVAARVLNSLGITIESPDA